MYWREVVVKTAAEALDHVGFTEEAALLRRLRIPSSDGGGLRLGLHHRDGSITVTDMEYQTTEIALSRAVLDRVTDKDTLDLSLILVIPLATKLVAECRLPAWLISTAKEDA